MPLRYSQDVQCEGNTMAGKGFSLFSFEEADLFVSILWEGEIAYCQEKDHERLVDIWYRAVVPPTLS